MADRAEKLKELARVSRELGDIENEIFALEELKKIGSTPALPAIESTPNFFSRMALAPVSTALEAGGKLLGEFAAKTDIEGEKQLAELAKTNPTLAQDIASTPKLERAAIATGAGITQLARGLGIAEPASPETLASDAAMTDTSFAGKAGQILGQALPAAPFGVGATAIGSLPLRAAATGAVGATQGAGVSRGLQESGGEQVKAAVFGGLIGSGAELAGPALQGVARAINRRLGIAEPPSKLVTPEGDLTPELEQYIAQKGIDRNQLIEEATNEVKTAETFIEAAPSTPGELVQMTDQAKLAAAAADVDPAVMQTYLDAGINIENIPLAAVARNKQVRAMSAQLAAIPGSPAQAQVAALADEVRNVARKTIEDAGGSMQSGTFSESTLAAMKATREDLYKAENAAYDALGRSLDEALGGSKVRVSVRADALASELAAKRSKLRATDISAVEKKVLTVLKSKPTYWDIDNLRKEIGDSVGDLPKGVYADQSQGTLKYLYGKLQDAQDRFARGVLGTDSLRPAQEVSKQKHAIQDQIEFFQKDGFASMVKKLGEAAGGLKAQDYQQFDIVMSNIPVQYRKGAVATMMNSALKVSPDQTLEGMRSADFVKMWGNIRGDAALNARIKNVLGDDSYAAFDAMATMANGLSKSMSGKATGVATESLKQWAAPGGVMSKLASILRVGSRAGAPGVGAAAETMDSVTRLALADKDAGIKKVTTLITSPTFLKTAAEVAKNPGSEQAKVLGSQLMKTKAANDFMQAASADVKTQIIAAGSIPAWLLSDEGQP